MYFFSATVRQDIENLKKKRMTKYVKKVLDEVLDYWHEHYLILKNKRTAYARYPGAFERRKKKGRPLYVTGHFADHITDPSQRARKTGPVTSRKIKIKFGRPERFNMKEMEKKIRWLMKKNRISRRAAEQKAYAKAGYSQHAKMVMIKAIPVINPQEIKFFERNIVKPGLTELMNKPRRKKRIKIGQ